MTLLEGGRIRLTLLVAYVLLGIFLMILSKFVELPFPPQLNTFLPALVSAAIIIIYAFIARAFDERGRIDHGQHGDNAYYLGFVLTLVSLAVTLYELSHNPETSEFTREVLSGFGIALSSTIIGVLVRLYFLQLQYRVDLAAAEKEIRWQLHDAMRRFYAEVEDAVRGTKYLGTEIRQSLDEHHQQMTESYRQHIEKLVGDVSTDHQKVLIAMLEQTNEASRELVSVTNSSISGIEKTVLETLSAVSGQVQDTNAAVNDSTRSAADILKSNLKEIGEVMSKEMQDLRMEVRRSVEEISRVHAESMKREAALADEAITSMQSIGSFAASARSSISSAENAVLETLNTVSGQLRESHDAINEGSRSTADALKRSLQEAGEVMSEGMKDLRTEVRHSVEEISRVHAENMKRQAALTDEAASSIPKAISAFAEKFEESSGKVGTMTEKFSHVCDRANEAMDQLTDNLEHLSKKISNQDGKPRLFSRIFDRSR